MIPIIGFIGEKKSGKTRILQGVIAVLTKKGKKVGVIKHTSHGFQLDYPETDSYKLYRAGAKKVALLGHGEFGFYGTVEGELGLEQVRDLYLPELDVVLVEGFKDAAAPKVLIALSGKAPGWAKDTGGLIGVVSPKSTGLKVKHFKPSQTRELAKLIEGYIKIHRHKREVKIYLDGKELFIKPFIKDFVLNTAVGMVGSLRDASGARRIQISIDLPEGVKVPAPAE